MVRSGVTVLVGAVTAVLFMLNGDAWLHNTIGTPVSIVLFAWLLVTMAACAFGAIRHADELAEILGEPYGTLLLTLSVVTIEVVLISMIMLTGNANPTLARDTMFSVLMIVLNAMVGGALIAGGLRYGQQAFNLDGARSYLGVIVPFAVIPLVLPNFTTSTDTATLTGLQALAFGLFTVLLYVVFLALQTATHRTFFEDPRERAVVVAQTHGAGHKGPHPMVHAALLVLLLLPFVAMAEELAHYVDYGIAELHAPPVLGGILIAALVLLPEGVSAVKAARADSLMRSVNICLGSALSTMGLTIPTVLLIGFLTGHTIILGLSEVSIVMLATTLLVSILTFTGRSTNVLQGLVHLVLFGVFLILAVHP